LLGAKKLIKRHNDKISAKFEKLNKEYKVKSIESVKEKDIYKYYWVDIMKRKSQANELKEEPLF